MLEVIKDKIEKRINNVIEFNNLTDLQVWGYWFAMGVVSALILIWIF